MNDTLRNNSNTTAKNFGYYQAPTYDYSHLSILGGNKKKPLDIKLLKTSQQANLSKISAEDIYTSVFAPIQTEIMRNIKAFVPIESGKKLVVIIMRREGGLEERPIRFKKMGHRWTDAMLSSNEKLLDYRLLFHGFFGSDFEDEFRSYCDEDFSVEARLMLIVIIKNGNTKVPPSIQRHHKKG